MITPAHAVAWVSMEVQSVPVSRMLVGVVSAPPVPGLDIGDWLRDEVVLPV